MARGKGEGSVYRNARGYWCASLELPPTVENGKVKRRRKVMTGKTKTAVMQKLRREEKELARRGDLSTRSITLENWLDKWLTDIAPLSRTPRTVASYRSSLKTHIVPRLGARRLDRLSAAMIRDAIIDIQTGKTSSGTARNAHTYLSAALADAVNDGWISDHPMRHLPLPRAKRKTAQALTLEQAIDLLRWLGAQMDKPAEQDPTDGLAALWVTFLLTGARRGELLGLRPEWVTTDDLRLEWQLQRIGAGDMAKAPTDYEYVHLEGTLWLVRPKSKAGWRAFPLVEPLKTFLNRVADASEPGKLLFRRPDGSPLDPDTITERWADMLIAAGIDSKVTLHGARHTVVDLLYILEVPEPIIMEIVGHSSRQVTRGYKSSYSPAVQKAMEQMSSMLQSGKAPAQLEG